MSRRLRLQVVLVAMSFGLLAEMSFAAKSADRADGCNRLVHSDFSGTLDAPARVDDVLYVPQGRKPAHCVVKGHVDPTVGFLLTLPDHWNGRFLELGCGGFCGGQLSETNLKTDDLSDLQLLRQGYAVLVFDGGNTGSDLNAQWAYNNLQAQFDFGIRGPHVVALAGKAIVLAYYRTPPTKAYFEGCSTGGQQALSEAQRFPWDFDGILVGAPSPTFSGPMMYYLWAARALAGVVNRADLEFVHQHAVARCDLDDGVKDGIIGDPVHCPFDPTELLCKANQSAKCLTPAQVQAVRKVYSGPTTFQGEKTYTGGPLPGSELNWITDELSGAYVAGGVAEPWAQEYFSNVGFMPAPGPNWNVADFDFDRDYKRLRLAESLFGAADNPDLRKFKAAGGKMLMFQGGQDQSDIPADAIDYYETTEKVMGGRAATQDFFRLFFIPGMNHCGGGVGASEIDYLGYLQAWVEQSRAPDVMIGAHPKEAYLAEAGKFPLDPAKIQFTRPAYPYPIRARYRGVGDPNDAASFEPVEP